MQKRNTPLGPLTSYTTVCPRVAVQLVAYDYRYNPELYVYRPKGVMNLADRLRRGGFPEMYPWLVSLAKALSLGWSMSQWCNHVIDVKYDAMRSIAKRPFTPTVHGGR